VNIVGTEFDRLESNAKMGITWMAMDVQQILADLRQDGHVLHRQVYVIRFVAMDLFLEVKIVMTDLITESDVK